MRRKHPFVHRPRFVARSLVLAIGCLAAALGACSRREGPRRVTIAFSNDLHGEIRSCGCAVKDYGGLGRRATFLTALRDTTGDLLLVDGGDIFSAGMNYGREKADLTLKSMARMGYQAVVVGEKDFGFGTDYIVKHAREVGLPIVVANLFDAVADTLLFPATREVALPSGLRIGLVGAISRTLKLPPQVHPGSLVIRDPVTTIRPLVDSLRTRVDLVVVVAHMNRNEARRLAVAVPGADIVVHGHEGMPMRRAHRDGNAWVLQAGDRGRYMGVAYATLGKDKRIASLSLAAVPLDKSYADDEGIAKLFQVYDIAIATHEKAAPADAGSAAAKDKFVSANTCRPCHGAFYDQWAQTPHAHAFETLATRGREFDRDCTPCHSTGFYDAGGFVSAAATPELTAVQCESCHGNGAAHARDPRVKTTADARAECRQCHTVDQTPDFAFEPFWAKLSNCSRAAAAAPGGR
jgi:Cytochrome c554 and c-prime/Calcineurin-like phosphoesterase